MGARGAEQSDGIDVVAGAPMFGRNNGPLLAEFLIGGIHHRETARHHVVQRSFLQRHLLKNMAAALMKEPGALRADEPEARLLGAQTVIDIPEITEEALVEHA